MSRKKLSIEEVRDIVDGEGLGYTIQNYLLSERIADKHLRECWDQAVVTLNEIQGILDDA